MGKKGRENAPQTDSGEWLIDTIKVTDKENNVGDYWSRNKRAPPVQKLQGLYRWKEGKKNPSQDKCVKWVVWQLLVVVIVHFTNKP